MEIDVSIGNTQTLFQLDPTDCVNSQETPFKPAFEFPYKMLLFGVPCLAGMVAARWLNQNWAFEQLEVGIWWFWWLRPEAAI
jgi:hypothetical protein